MKLSNLKALANEVMEIIQNVLHMQNKARPIQGLLDGHLVII